MMTQKKHSRMQLIKRSNSNSFLNATDKTICCFKIVVMVYLIIQFLIHDDGLKQIYLYLLLPFSIYGLINFLRIFFSKAVILIFIEIFFNLIFIFIYGINHLVSLGLSIVSLFIISGLSIKEKNLAK